MFLAAGVADVDSKEFDEGDPCARTIDFWRRPSVFGS
jgi:hypothetical protein